MKVLVTAGPTREYIDPVRFISNRSSGKMGYAIAESFVERGHEVVLVSGPVSIITPKGVRLIHVISASEMHEAVRAEFADSDALIMCAAVADWRPAQISDSKIKKGGARLMLELVPTADILTDISKFKGHRVIAGFAAETGNPELEGRRKLIDKGLDVIFCNDVMAAGAGFECDTNRIVSIDRAGKLNEWPLMSKKEAGNRIACLIESACAEAHRLTA